MFLGQRQLHDAKQDPPELSGGCEGIIRWRDGLWGGLFFRCTADANEVVRDHAKSNPALR